MNAISVAAKSLMGLDVKPRCRNHKPESSEIHFDDNTYTVMIHCKECLFTMFVHPSALEDVNE